MVEFYNYFLSRSFLVLLSALSCLYPPLPHAHTQSHTSYEKKLSSIGKVQSHYIELSPISFCFQDSTDTHPATHGRAIVCLPLNGSPLCSHPPSFVPPLYLVLYWLLHDPKMSNQLFMCSWDNRMFQERAMLCINRVHRSQSIVVGPMAIHVWLPSCDVK